MKSLFKSASSFNLIVEGLAVCVQDEFRPLLHLQKSVTGRRLSKSDSYEAGQLRNSSKST
jgi:hypothetical protein